MEVRLKNKKLLNDIQAAINVNGDSITSIDLTEDEFEDFLKVVPLQMEIRNRNININATSHWEERSVVYRATTIRTLKLKVIHNSPSVGFPLGLRIQENMPEPGSIRWGKGNSLAGDTL